jgi:hypothetical protein
MSHADLSLPQTTLGPVSMAHASQQLRAFLSALMRLETDNVVARYDTTIWFQPSGEPCTDKAISWHIRKKSPAAGPRDLCPCHSISPPTSLPNTPYRPAQAPGVTLCPILPHSNEPLDFAEHNLFFHVLNTLPSLPRPNVAAGPPSISPCPSTALLFHSRCRDLSDGTFVCGLCCIHHDNTNFWA